MTTNFFHEQSVCFLLIATIGDLLMPFFLSPFCKDYSHSKMVMSVLGNKNHPIHALYNTWLVLAGILFLISGVRLYALYAPTSKFLATCLLISFTIYAIGACILSGLFSVGVTKELTTLSEKIHGYGSVIGFFILIFAPLVLSGLLFMQHENYFAVVALICFFLALASFVIFVMADKPEFCGTFIENEGIWQRLCLLFAYLPFATLAIKMLLQLKRL